MENSQENIVLRVEGLSKAYKKGVFASKGVSFSVKKGEIFALIGPNGAGKTTTIRMIATLLKPTEGDARRQFYNLSARKGTPLPYISAR